MRQAANNCRRNEVFLADTGLLHAELDLLVVRGQEKVGFEVKRTTAPAVTASLRSAIETLGLDRAYLVHAGRESFPLPRGVEALALADVPLRTGL